MGADLEQKESASFRVHPCPKSLRPRVSVVRVGNKQGLPQAGSPYHSTGGGRAARPLRRYSKTSGKSPMLGIVGWGSGVLVGGASGVGVTVISGVGVAVGS